MSALLAGVDEAGRGPLAGPVVVAAVILDPARPLAGLADSKTLSASRRVKLAEAIKAQALAWSIIAVEADEIDRLNILQATFEGMRRALAALQPVPTEAWIDGNQIPPGLTIPARAIVQGDASVAAISAASILAKTQRDATLLEMEARYPGYGFALHKGYPTPQHLAALDQLGPCPIHRQSYAPVRLRVMQGRLF
jgi:ribonuclease HII